MARTSTDIIKLIESRRHDQRISKAELARAIGVTPQRYSQWLSRGNIPMEERVNIGKALDLPVLELMGIDADTTTSKPIIDTSSGNETDLEDALQLIEKWRKLSPKHKKTILTYIEILETQETLTR